MDDETICIIIIIISLDSEYLLKELISTKLYGTIPNTTSYFNGYRHLGGL